MNPNNQASNTRNLSKDQFEHLRNNFIKKPNNILNKKP